jgi:plasmid stabilization system protein ParE
LRVVWSAQAHRDLRSILKYIAVDSPAYAGRQIERILETESVIAEFPRAGRRVPEYDDPKLREVLCDNFRIIYRITTEDHIDILTVVHGRRSLD